MKALDCRSLDCAMISPREIMASLGMTTKIESRFLVASLLGMTNC